MIQSLRARRDRTERAIGATRARTTRDKVYFFQHSRHDERRGIGRKRQTPSAQTTRRVPDLGALALGYLSDSKRCGCHRKNQRNVMVKRGTSIQGLEHEEATKSKREAWLHSHGKVNSWPQAMPTSWHPSFHDSLLLGYLP